MSPLPTQPTDTTAFFIDYDEATNTINTAFNGQHTYTSDAIVKEAHRRINEIKDLIAKKSAGRVLYVKGAVTVAAAYVICAALKNLVKVLAVYDPRLIENPNESAYIVTFTFSPDYAVGDVIRIPDNKVEAE